MEETTTTSESESESTDKATPKRKLRRAWRWLLICAAIVCVGVVVWLLTVEVALWRGAANIEARRHDRALRWLETAERIAPPRAELHFLLARCYRRLEEFDDVEDHLRQAHKLEWDVNQLEREQWIALAQTGQYDAMSSHWAELFEDVGSDGPEISRAYTTMCLALFRFQEANEVLAAWEKDFPEDAEPLVMRGRLSETNLNWAGAVDHYREALRLDPQRQDAHFGLAKALVNLGQVEKAREILKSVVKQEPENWEARLVLAQCLVKLDQLSEARSELEKVVTAQPSNADALLEAGNVELAQHNTRLAAKYLKKALELKPENREIAYAAARTFQAAGDHEEARKLFKFVDEATEPLIRLKKLIGQLLAEPDNLDLRFEVALITWRYKSREEGERWLLSLLNFEPRHPPTHALLAEHFNLNGDQKRALFHKRLAEAAAGQIVPPDEASPEKPDSSEP
jgi:tetratricopeptide (TPR) repeat protein